MSVNQAGVAWTFRLLAAMLQGSDEFMLSFQEADGYRAMATSLPRHSASLPVLLTALALALGVPIAALPATGEGMGAASILSILRRNAGVAVGPSGGFGAGSSPVGSASGGGGVVRGGDEPRAFVRVCVAKVLLPALRFNAAIVRRAEAAGVGGVKARTPHRGRQRGRTEEGASLSPATPVVRSTVGASRSPITPAPGGTADSSGGAAEVISGLGVPMARGGGVSGSGGAEASEASDWRRAKTTNEIVSAAMQEALLNDPSFRLACRSADVVGALVDVLGGTWDEPEPNMGGSVGGAGKSDPERREEREDEEIEVEGGCGRNNGKGVARAIAGRETLVVWLF